jgi:hypothetical protein
MLTTASVNIHNNNTRRERKRAHRNTYGHGMGIKQCGGLFDQLAASGEI